MRDDGTAEGEFHWNSCDGESLTFESTKKRIIVDTDGELVRIEVDFIAPNDELAVRTIHPSGSHSADDYPTKNYRFRIEISTGTSIGIAGIAIDVAHSESR